MNFAQKCDGSRQVLLNLGLVISAAFVLATEAAGEQVLRMSENRVPVALVEVNRNSDYTEVRLRTEAARKNVCWAFSGPNSPYLLASGKRYRFKSGDIITDCPTSRDYAPGAIMVLRFEPLPAGPIEFSLVEGQAGENQLIDPASEKGRTYWNFLRVKLR